MTQSNEKQNFKIGRMTYGLPSYVTIDGGEPHFLSFDLSSQGTWKARYKRGLYYVLMDQEEPTFNKVIIAMHKALKEIEQ